MYMYYFGRMGTDTWRSMILFLLNNIINFIGLWDHQIHVDEIALSGNGNVLCSDATHQWLGSPGRICLFQAYQRTKIR